MHSSQKAEAIPYVFHYSGQKHVLEKLLPRFHSDLEEKTTYKNILHFQGVFINEVHFLMTTKSKSASLRANHMLVLNLSIADTLMGIYLVILGAASIKYHGVYCAEDHAWRASNLCVTMGVIVVLASETSVMTMVLLTIFRLYAVYKVSENALCELQRFKRLKPF